MYAYLDTYLSWCLLQDKYVKQRRSEDLRHNIRRGNIAKFIFLLTLFTVYLSIPFCCNVSLLSLSYTALYIDFCSLNLILLFFEDFINSNNSFLFFPFLMTSSYFICLFGWILSCFHFLQLNKVPQTIFVTILH